MTQTQAPPDIVKRVLYILHHGLNDLRNRAIQEDEQAADLADALEILPGMLLDWSEEKCEMARWVLNNYQSKYPGIAFDYLKYLIEYPVPDRF